MLVGSLKFKFWSQLHLSLLDCYCRNSEYIFRFVIITWIYEDFKEVENLLAARLKLFDKYRIFKQKIVEI